MIIESMILQICILASNLLVETILGVLLWFIVSIF
jgi:hypothetical protein